MDVFSTPLTCFNKSDQPMSPSIFLAARKRARTHTHTQTHIYRHTHKHTQIHTNTHKHTQTHTNTHKHTQTTLSHKHTWAGLNVACIVKVKQSLIDVCVCVWGCGCLRLCLEFVSVPMSSFLSPREAVCMHCDVCIFMLTCEWVCAHTHTHTHT